MKPRLPIAICATAIGVVLLSGCAGGGARYDSTAFAACLSREGASTFGTSVMSAKQRAALAGIVRGSPFVGARFPGGEEDGFVFASDAAAAKGIEGRIKALASSPLAMAGVVTSDGNLVLLMPRHSTAGVQKVIVSCKADARLT